MENKQGGTAGEKISRPCRECFSCRYIRVKSEAFRSECLFLYGDESKFELARNLDDCLQSQNVPLALLVICITTSQGIAQKQVKDSNYKRKGEET